MKRLILVAGFLCVVWQGHSQGQVIFANNAATTISNLITGVAAGLGTRVGLYIGAVGDSMESLTLIGAVTNCYAAGRFNGGTRTLAGWTGTVQLQVRAWLADTVYPSWEAAIAAAYGGDSSVVAGCSLPFAATLTQPPNLPSSLPNLGLTPFPIGYGCLAPEPPAGWLAGLALAALGVLARCKRRR